MLLAGSYGEIITYCNNTFRDDIPLVHPYSSLLLSLEVLLISPDTKSIEQPPKGSIQSVPLLIVGRMRTTGATQKVGGQRNHTRGTQTVGATIPATQNWAIGRLPIAVGVTRKGTS